MADGSHPQQAELETVKNVAQANLKMHLHPFAIRERGCAGSRSMLLKDPLVVGRR